MARDAVSGRWAWVLAAAGLALAAACSDATTGGAGGTEAGAAACSDGLDNDGDGWTDCGDQDCWGQGVCGDGGDAEGDGKGLDDAMVEDVADVAEDVVQDATAPPTDAPAQPETPPATGTCEPCGYGAVKGVVCAPNEQIYVNDAKVTIQTFDCDGKPITLSVKSDKDGRYQFDQVPCGQHTLVIQKGSFSTQAVVQVKSGHTTDTSGAAYKLCFQATKTKIAVLDGNWDDLGGIVAQLGFGYDLYTPEDTGEGEGTILALLADPIALGQYDIVFAACGTYNGWMPQDHPEVMDNLVQFVEGGGSLWMSDYAWVYGEYGFPDAIEYFGSDDVMDMYKKGSPQQLLEQSLTGEILDGAMAAYLGKQTLQVHIDKGPQIAPQAAGTGTMVHVQAKVVQGPLSQYPLNATIPLVLSYKPGPEAGRVIYTNFHNDAQATEDIVKLMHYLVFTL